MPTYARFHFRSFIECVYRWYGHSAGKAVEENSSVFSLIRMRSLQFLTRGAS